MTSQMMRLLTLIWISGVLAGCANSKDTVLPNDGPTMKQIYDQHFSTMNAVSVGSVRSEVTKRLADDEEGTLTAYARESATELDAHFPRLPNPTLILYVFPHLAGPERVPIPGYTTRFPMYDTTEYALPGEVPMHSSTPRTATALQP